MGNVLTMVVTGLKIAGGILLLLLAILLFLVCLILFVPVRYEAFGSVEKDWHLKAKVTWLYRLIRISVLSAASGELIVEVKVLWFTLFPQPEKMRHLEEKTISARERSEEKSTGKGKAGKAEQKEEKRVKEERKDKEEDADPPKIQRIKMHDIEKEAEAVYKKEEYKKSIKKKEKKAEKSIKEEEGLTMSYFYHMEWEEKKELLSLLLETGKKLWRFIMPDKLEVSGVFGTGDPANTGMLLGIFAMGTILYGDAVCVKGDFENKTLQGSLFVKGHMRTGTLLFIFLRLLLKKPVWRCIKLYRKGLV